jgi:hypothetical protein
VAKASVKLARANLAQVKADERLRREQRDSELADRGLRASLLTGRPVPIVRSHAHGGHPPSHHVGECDAACRAGRRAHAHRVSSRTRTLMGGHT